MYIAIDRRANLNTQHLKEMHKLRARIFKERKDWEVSVIAEMEIDGYDALDPYYMIMSHGDADTNVSGCWRILPTTGPNMLAHTFTRIAARRTGTLFGNGLGVKPLCHRSAG
ncbi:MAG: acyl-homoserine-lactone synthase [Pseudomonas sp.]|nr:acyl-homoserine-lactone synthase [Pseudomonas sp.]